MSITLSTKPHALGHTMYVLWFQTPGNWTPNLSDLQSNALSTWPHASMEWEVYHTLLNVTSSGTCLSPYPLSHVLPCAWPYVLISTPPAGSIPSSKAHWTILWLHHYEFKSSVLPRAWVMNFFEHRMIKHNQCLHRWWHLFQSLLFISAPFYQQGDMKAKGNRFSDPMLRNTRSGHVLWFVRLAFQSVVVSFQSASISLR